MTVSFGVTEIQPGDTPETMLRRADRALLMAKANGRNSVVQLGSGSSGETAERRRRPGSSAPPAPRNCSNRIWSRRCRSRSPSKSCAGFVADHQAKIVAIDGSQVRLEIEDKPAGRLRRLTDRTVAFLVDLSFEEERPSKARAEAGQKATRTKIQVTVSPRRNRDRRRNEVMACARELMASFRSYLMATEDDTDPPGVLDRAKRILAPWLVKPHGER